jgi:hypothetical protein
MILAAKSIPRGIPCSSSKDLPPQSPIGGNQGNARNQTDALRASTPDSPIPTADMSQRWDDQTEFASSGGHPRRAAKCQKTPGITIAPEKIAAVQAMEPNSHENAPTQAGAIVAAVHKSILVALRGLHVATKDATIAINPATMPIPIATGVGPRNPPATATISIPRRRPTRNTNQLIICRISRKSSLLS